MTRIVSHPTDNEKLDGIVNDIKARICEHKEMENFSIGEGRAQRPPA